MEETRKKSLGAAEIIGLIVLALILIANFLIIQRSAFRGFSFFDWGSFLDASWRVYRGQKPYTDFFYTTGPVHLYMLAVFYWVFGFGKAAILAHMVTLSSLIILGTYFVLLKRVPIWVTLIVTFLAACSYYWPHPHPWYIHSAHFWGIMASLLLLWRMPFRTDKDALITGAITGLLAFLSLMTKSDVGAANGLAFFIIFLFSEKRLRSVAGYIAGNLAAVILCAVFFSLIGYFNDAVQGYGVGASRQIIRLLFIPTWFKNYYWLPALTLPFVFKYLQGPKRCYIWLFYGICFAGLFSLNIGSLRGTSHIPPMSTYLAVAFVIIFEVKGACSSLKNRLIRYAVLGVLLFVTGLQIMRTVRHGISLAVRTDGIEGSYLQGTYPLTRGAMKGWFFEENQGKIVDQVLQFIDQNIKDGEDLLILTDLQFINSFSGHDAMTGVPFLWDIGEVPEPQKLRPQISRSIQERMPEWILLHKEDNEQVPISRLVSYLELDQTILRHYRLAATFGKYGILRKVS